VVKHSLRLYRGCLKPANCPTKFFSIVFLDDANKRAIKITSSPKGRTLIADLLPQAKAHEKKVLANYSEEQQQLLKGMLRRLVVHLQG